MSAVLLILLFISLLEIVGAFAILRKYKSSTAKKIANVLFVLGEAFLLVHIFILIINLIMYGISDFSLLLTFGETYALLQAFLEYTRRSNLNRKTLIVHTIIIIGSVLFLFPLVWMISTALKPLHLTMTVPPQIFFHNPQFGNFIKCLNYQAFSFGIYARNTLYLCILSVLGTVLSSSFVAYGFSRIRWRGRDFFFFLTLCTMMVPFPVYMIPLFKLFRIYNWVGTFKPLWVPAFFGSAFNIFLLRQFFLTIPHELSDAAHIDGGGDLLVYTRIILPLAKPALLVVGLFQFLFTWNDFLAPLIYLSNQKTFTLSLGLQFFQSQHGGTEWNLLMAASTLVVLPVLVLFFFTQKYFTRGISMTGLQG
jgi:ABC-type glycerol-3-phosphate transport system permease component